MERGTFVYWRAEITSMGAPGLLLFFLHIHFLFEKDLEVEKKQSVSAEFHQLTMRGLETPSVSSQGLGSLNRGFQV